MSRSRSSYTTFYKIIETFGVFCLTVWVSVLFVSTFFFIIKRPISFVNVLFSITLALAFILYYTKSKFENYLWYSVIAVLLFIVTFIPSLYLSGKIYDLSYDGQAYHQEAVIQFKRGWNPVYMILTNEATANLERWLNHYPKAVWITAANIYEITGNIEHGKVLSIYAGLIAFVFCLWALWRTPLSWTYKIVGSFLLAFNPVFIYQSLSYYLDGVLVSLLICLVAICYKIYLDKDKYLIFPFIFVFILSTNVKLTGVVYATLIILAFISYFWFSDRLKPAFRMFKYFLVGLFLGVILIGYNPYITNFALKGHPLYPAMGKNALNYVPDNTPENFWNLPSPLRFLASIFSKSSLVRGKGKFAELKVPFSFNIRELETFRVTNAKTGGFGPLFGGIFALASVMLVNFLISSEVPIRQRKAVLYFLLILLSVASMVALSSVARFIPFVWWIPGIVLLIYQTKPYLSWRFLSLVLTFLLIFNIALIAYSYFPYNIKESEKLKNQLSKLAQNQSNTPTAVFVGQFGSTKIKLRSYRITYNEVMDETECKKYDYLLTNNVSKFCKQTL